MLRHNRTSVHQAVWRIDPDIRIQLNFLVPRAEIPVCAQRFGGGRFCEPSSELHIAEDWYRRTALCDLLQLGDEEITKDRLYRGLGSSPCPQNRAGSASVAPLRRAIRSRERSLLYDVTSTYFEGQGGPVRF
jgi:hypothetical protein